SVRRRFAIWCDADFVIDAQESGFGAGCPELCNFMRTNLAVPAIWCCLSRPDANNAYQRATNEAHWSRALLRNEALDVLALRPGASALEIKGAYRDLVKVWHPDRFGSDPRLRE